MIARRRALLFLLALLQLDAIWSIRPRQLEPLLWSVHNPMFSRETDATLDVQIGEFINFVCPRQETGGDAGNAATEYHCIYMVSKHEYDECRVDGLERRKPVLKCDRPHDSLKYTLYISRYSPVPGAIEFMPGSSYYFICKLHTNSTRAILLFESFFQCSHKMLSTFASYVKWYKKRPAQSHRRHLQVEQYAPCRQSIRYIFGSCFCCCCSLSLTN